MVTLPADGRALPHAVIGVQLGELGVAEVVLALNVPPEVEGVVEGDDLPTGDRASVAPVEAVPADPLLEPEGGVDVHDFLSRKVICSFNFSPSTCSF